MLYKTSNNHRYGFSLVRFCRKYGIYFKDLKQKALKFLNRHMSKGVHGDHKRALESLALKLQGPVKPLTLGSRAEVQRSKWPSVLRQRSHPRMYIFNHTTEH